MTSKFFYQPPSLKNQEDQIQACVLAMGKEKLLSSLEQMLLIRQFEAYGESAYQQGLVGGFYHSYIGQEALQTAAISAFGKENWYITTYRCHALALLLGADPNELMAELYGRASGNAKGRGGSMHFFTSRMLGGFGIVGGHISIAAGAAFSLKYLKKKEELALCFLGDGAVAQGTIHETLNLATLWELPLVVIIENNQWGMGTHVSRAISFSPIAEQLAKPYRISSYTLNGMDFFNSYLGFTEIKKEALSTSRPILVECLCERFKGHSISDAGLYRTKEEIQSVMKKDPILFFSQHLIKAGLLTEEQLRDMELKQKEKVKAAMEYASKAPWPSEDELEKEVYAD